MTNIAKFVCVLTIAILLAIVITSRPDNGTGLMADTFSGVKHSPAADAWRFIAGLAISTGTALGRDRYEGRTEANEHQVYRWQDETGTWHYTDRPPAGVKAEAMTLAKPTTMAPAPLPENEGSR